MFHFSLTAFLHHVNILLQTLAVIGYKPSRKRIPQCISRTHAKCSTGASRIKIEVEFISANNSLSQCDFDYRVSKAEENLQDDDVVSKLEEECNWFRNELNRLQQQVATMEKDKQVNLTWQYDTAICPSSL